MSIAVFAISTAAFAGNVTYVAPEVVAIEEPARMGGSGAWLIPLVVVPPAPAPASSNNSNSSDADGS